MKQSRLYMLGAMVVGAALMRFIPHPWNFTPVAALALFSGAHFERRSTALLIPITALLLSDIVLGFHSTMPFVYGAFVGMVYLGWFIRENRSALRVMGSSLVGSIMFFVVTNFGVWLVGGLYEFSWNGLSQCFIAAIPFFRTTLAGDLFYTAVLFGSFAWAERRFLMVRPLPESA